MPQGDSAEAALRRRWVETWQRAAPELERIRRAEIQSLDTREAVRQIFAGWNIPFPPAPPTSGLIEQQAWFSRLREAKQRK